MSQIPYWAAHNADFAVQTCTESNGVKLAVLVGPATHYRVQCGTYSLEFSVTGRKNEKFALWSVDGEIGWGRPVQPENGESALRSHLKSTPLTPEQTETVVAFLAPAFAQAREARRQDMARKLV